MEFMLNPEEDYIYNALLLNNSFGPPDLSAPPFGMQSAGSSQLFDTSAQFQQKPASNDSSHGETQRFMISSNGAQHFPRGHLSAPMSTNSKLHGETQRFMISSNGAQHFPRGHLSAPMSTNSKLAEATRVTTSEPWPPQSVGLSNLASLSVNPGGAAKVGKKRSRASRRTPTTVLNTDISNFRAMVQRFTGIPETPFGYSSVNPTLSAHVTQQGWQVLGKPLPYKAVLDLNDPDSYCPQLYNSSTFIPFRPLHDNINTSGPKYPYPQGLDGAGVINSGSVFPTQL